MRLLLRQLQRPQQRLPRLNNLIEFSLYKKSPVLSEPEIFYAFVSFELFDAFNPFFCSKRFGTPICLDCPCPFEDFILTAYSFCTFFFFVSFSVLFFLCIACPFRLYDIHRVCVVFINEYDAFTLNVIAHDINKFPLSLVILKDA